MFSYNFVGSKYYIVLPIISPLDLSAGIPIILKVFAIYQIPKTTGGHKRLLKIALFILKKCTEILLDFD